MSKLLAYHDDPKIKSKYIQRMREHRKAEHLTQGMARDG